MQKFLLLTFDSLCMAYGCCMHHSIPTAAAAVAVVLLLADKDCVGP